VNDTTEDHPSTPAVVIYIKPADTRVPKAAWFDASVKATAILNAQRQGFTVIETREVQIDLVKAALAEGDVTAAGKVVLNPVKRDVLDRLLANLAGEPVEALDGSGKLPPGAMPTYVGSSDTIPVSQVPVDPLWAALTVNMVVLAPEQTDQGAPEGWWEAVITAIHGDVLTLRFRDYSRQPLVHRKRDEIAIMYPPPVRVLTTRGGFRAAPLFCAWRDSWLPPGPLPDIEVHHDHQDRAHSCPE
jgi:hypothetical protein